MKRARTTAGENLPCRKIRRGQKKLTPKQYDYIDQFVEERIAAILSTDPIDESEAEQHLRAAYRVAGLEPVLVRWFDSPVAFVLALFSSEKTRVENNVWDSIVGDVIGSVENSVLDSVLYSVHSTVQEDMRSSVSELVGFNMGLIVAGSVAAQIEKHLQDNVRYSAEDSVDAYTSGHVHSSFRLLHEMFEENDLIHFALCNEMVCGYRLGSEEAWLVRKPIRLERDARGWPHCADGMCVQFRDGWGFYAWHGTRCSEQLILHPEQITKEEWMNERDLEIRRIMQERLGNDRFVELVGGKCIEQGRRADLIEVDLGRNDPERVARFVRVKDTSTERIYYLRVPPTFEQADAALAWTFGLEVQDYQPVQEA